MLALHQSDVHGFPGSTAKNPREEGARFLGSTAKTLGKIYPAPSPAACRDGSGGRKGHGFWVPQQKPCIPLRRRPRVETGAVEESLFRFAVGADFGTIFLSDWCSIGVFKGFLARPVVRTFAGTRCFKNAHFI